MKTEVIWEKPEIEDLGKANDLIQAVNVVLGGDAQFSVLQPS
jgi:hypothetical protein